MVSSSSSLEDLQEATSLSKHQLLNLLSVSAPTLSLNAPYGSQDASDELGDYVSDTSHLSLNTDFVSTKKQSKQDIQLLLSNLKPREQMVISLRYGLQDGIAGLKKILDSLLRFQLSESDK